jgi:dsDNA-specific endonuclease/ATPase MutS2
MRYLRGIIIAAVTVLLGLFLLIFRPWRSGADHVETGPTGGLNAAQGNNNPQNATQPVPNVNQSVKDLRQAANEAEQAANRARQAADEARNAANRAANQAREEVKQQVTDNRDNRGAKQPEKSAKRSTAKMRRAVEQEAEDCDCQDVGTQGVQQVVIDVIEPTEYDEEETTVYVQPGRTTEGMKNTGYWTTTQSVNVTVPQSQACPTPSSYSEVWVECCDQ